MRALALWLACAGCLAAQEARLDAALERSRIYVGESVVYQVSLVNAPKGVRPEVQAPGGVELRFLGVREESRSFFDGVRARTERIRHFLYRALTTRVGVFTFPPPRCRVGGRELTGPAVRLTVVEPERQDVVRVHLSASAAEVFREEPFVLTLAVEVRALPPPYADQDPVLLLENPPNLRIPWLKPPAGLEAEDPAAWLDRYASARGGFTVNRRRSDFPSLFFRAPTYRPRPERVRRRTASGKEGLYYRYVFQRTFRPRRAGAYTFGGVVVEGDFLTGVEERTDVFGRRRAVGVTERIYAVGPPVTVTVREPPAAGRPPTWTGGIGRFQVTADVQPRKLRVGEPLTLTVTVRGEGGLEEVGPVRLSAVPAIAAAFKVYEDLPPGELRQGEKVFVYSLRPLTVVTAFPPVPFSYFDLDRRAYVTVKTKPIPLTVKPAERLAPGEVEGRRGEAPGRELRAEVEGLFANITDVRRLRNDRLDPRPWLAGVGGLLALYGLLALAVGWWRRRHGDPRAVRRRRAWREAAAALAAARRAEDPLAVVAAVEGALTRLVADLRGVAAAGLTRRDVVAFFRDVGEEEAARRVAALFEVLEAAAFGGVRPDLAEARRLAGQAETLIRSLRPRLRRLAAAALLVLLAPPLVGQADRVRLFLKAQERFEAARTPAAYLEAAALFRAVLDRHFRSGIVLYNLGNAYFKAGRLGEAIAAYREAKRYLPNDPHLDANLRLALSKREDAFPAESGRSLLDHVFFWVGALPMRTQVQLTLAVAGVTFLLALARLFRPRPALGGGAIAGVALTLLLAAGTLIAWYRAEGVPQGVITAREVTVRKAPGGPPAYDRPIHAGTEFALLEVRRRGGEDRWYRIRFAGGREGWVPAGAVTWIGPPPDGAGP